MGGDLNKGTLISIPAFREEGDSRCFGSGGLQ